MNQTSLTYLFLTFLKIGSTAFGGYMSLVAIVQKQLVEIDRRLREEDLLNGISLTSVLPGPVAVNTIAYVGYVLRGLPGALAAFAGIILPSFLLVLLLSKVYFTWGDTTVIKSFFAGIVPALTALIINVAWGMARKTLKSRVLVGVCTVSALLLILVGGYWTTLLLMILGGIVGWYCCGGSTAQPGEKQIDLHFDASRRRFATWIGGVAGLIILLAVVGRLPEAPASLQLFSVFSGVSLTLFGGGYVVIPTLHELIVDNLQWLTDAEFADGIAIGQVTPGPIFITATFIGYKVAGLLGATLATIAIFTPPALLTVCLSSFVNELSRSTRVKAVLSGVRAAVVGLIFASAWTIGRTAQPVWGCLLLFLATLFITFRWNVNPILIILGSGLLGILIL